MKKYEQGDRVTFNGRDWKFDGDLWCPVGGKKKHLPSVQRTGHDTGWFAGNGEVKTTPLAALKSWYQARFKDLKSSIKEAKDDLKDAERNVARRTKELSDLETEFELFTSDNL